MLKGLSNYPLVDTEIIRMIKERRKASKSVTQRLI